MAKFRETAGGIIIREDRVILVETVGKSDPKDRYWSWPKGGVEKGEKTKEALFREIEEETGLKKKHLDLLEKDPIAEYTRTSRDGVEKLIRLFLLATVHDRFKPQCERHPRVACVPLPRPLEMLLHTEDRDAYAGLLDHIRSASQAVMQERR